MFCVFPHCANCCFACHSVKISRIHPWFAQSWNTPWKTVRSLKTPWKWFSPWKLLEFEETVLEFYAKVLEYLRIQQNKLILTSKDWKYCVNIWHQLRNSLIVSKTAKLFIAGQFSGSYSKYLSNRTFNGELLFWSDCRKNVISCLWKWTPWISLKVLEKSWKSPWIKGHQTCMNHVHLL